MKKSLTFMLCFILAGMSSCSYIDEKDQPLEVEAQSDRATFSVTECNLNNDVNNVNSFLGSFLRSEFKYDCSDTYNFDNTKIIKDSDKPRNIVLVPSIYNNNEFLTYEKIENDIISVSSMTIEEKEHTATFSYKSIVDNSILFSGHIDKKTNTLFVDYVSDSLKNNTDLRASTSGLGCNLAAWGAGASWSFAVGLINPFAGLAVSLAYTVAGYYICDRLD